jgi:phytoene desaturase
VKKVVIIGSGFAGMSAATFMARDGWDVTVIEKNSLPGGRARKLSEAGFQFDMGPSWYWMPEVFERYFKSFGRKVSDFYTLERLDPSYRVYWADGPVDIPADYEKLRVLFESIEAGSATRLDQFLEEAAYKYDVGINKLVHKPGRSLAEFLDMELARGVLKLDVFTSMKKHVSRFFTHPKLQQLMEFPVLFLGAMPDKIPALYSLMNYADIKGGTWYPRGGMYEVVNAMFKLACEMGVKFHFNEDATAITTEKGRATAVRSMGKLADGKLSANTFQADAVIGAADYHFIESKLLQPGEQSYTEKYWDSRVMAPSCLLYYVGINKRLQNILHHSLFFDVDFSTHGKEIYETPAWPSNPLFYVSATSVTDPGVAPAGHENLFFLVPVAAGLEGDDEELRDRYFNMMIERLEKATGESIKDAVVFKKTYAVSDFVNDYNAFKGNAYGLANTLLQTAILKPSIKSRKIENLFYTGQLTVPGPGVPPSLISGEVVAREVVKQIKS